MFVYLSLIMQERLNRLLTNFVRLLGDTWSVMSL